MYVCMHACMHVCVYVCQAVTDVVRGALGPGAWSQLAVSAVTGVSVVCLTCPAGFCFWRHVFFFWFLFSAVAPGCQSCCGCVCVSAVAGVSVVCRACPAGACQCVFLCVWLECLHVGGLLSVSHICECHMILTCVRIM